jgi:hypothetical protein
VRLLCHTAASFASPPCSAICRSGPSASPATALYPLAPALRSLVRRLQQPPLSLAFTQLLCEATKCLAAALVSPGHIRHRWRTECVSRCVRTHCHAPHTSLCASCAFAICACASPVSVHRWCCVIAAPPGACRLPPRPRPTWSSRLRQVDALLPCANPCARTSACLPRRHYVRFFLLREYDSPFYLRAQPLHRHLASQPCAALWRLGLEQLPPRAQKCAATVPCVPRPPTFTRALLLFWYTSTPSRIIHRHLCPCVALPPCIAAPCRPRSPQVVPCYGAARVDIPMPSPCGQHFVSGARREYH